jgi:hypothetical protein
MRKILIATPIKGGLGSDYLPGFVDAMRTRFDGVQLEFAVLDGPAVNLARNELAQYAKDVHARELVFIDSDIKWTVDHFRRLISHVDLDIVGGIYCKKVAGERPFWLMNPKPGGLNVDSNAELEEVNDIATGFMKIRVDTVFPAIEKVFPELEFMADGTGGKPARSAWEYFPMGVEGPRHPKVRLDKVKAALAKLPGPLDPVDSESEWKRRVRLFIAEVDNACHESQPPGMLRGEDYGFCHLARSAGCKVWADFGMDVLPHVGKVAYPITPDMVNRLP